MNEENQSPRQGAISDLGVLDLRYAKSPEDLKGITAIHDVGVVLIGEEAAPALNQIQVHDVGSIVNIPANVKVNCMTGQVKISGESLENGDPEAVLMLVGQVIISGSISKVGYKEIRAVGQLLVPRDSQAAFSAKLAQLTGQILYVPENFRLVMGSETFDRDFLELLPEPTAFVIMGSLTFNADIDRDLVQAKISEVTLLGSIKAPQPLVNILNILTREKFGKIEAVS